MQNIPASNENKIQALAQNPYFSGLTVDLLETLAQGTHLRRYERGEVICWQGEPCTGLYILADGSVKLFKLSPRGREFIIRVLLEGATFNEVPVFDYGANAVNVAALEDSEIWIVDAAIIRQAMREQPEMAQAVIKNLTANLRMLVNLVEELSFHQVTNRLARLIAQLSPDQLGGQSNPRLTQDLLAARLGTVREVVARSLRELEGSGAIRVQRRQIQILDESLLRDWAQESNQ
jgi:CRP/FNR family transcriptional regulator